MIAGRLILLLTIMSMSLSAQQSTKKPPPKPFTPPPPTTDVGTLFGGPLLKDEACSKDYAKSLNMEGLEKRKYIADLITYGCAIALRGVYRTSALETIEIKTGEKITKFRHVFLTLLPGVSDEAYGKGADATRTREGWAPADNLLPYPPSPDQIDFMVKQIRESEQH
jgi:hypothetical protein